jgi:hypothetical protein
LVKVPPTILLLSRGTMVTVSRLMGVSRFT